MVSVVTPFHNTAEYLAECIESVLAQDFTDFEYILVNNQSTDGSAEIAAAYAERDPRIRYTETDHLLPQLDNYNAALEKISASSVYCKMCQADDWLFPRCLTELVAFATEHPSAAIVNSFSMRGEELLNAGLPAVPSLLTGRGVCRRYFLRGEFVFGNPTSVLYDADLVRNRQPFFEPDRLHADTELCFEVLADADFGFVPQVLSYLRSREESISGGRTDLLPRDLDRMMMVERYASEYLTPEERDEVVDATRSAYYRRLGQRTLRALVQRPDPGFWQYHREGLASVGQRLSYPRVGRAVAAELAIAVLSPGATVSALYRRFRGKGPTPGAVAV
jgi:glycosyltransferase involved in cell wall biosynthesis